MLVTISTREAYLETLESISVIAEIMAFDWTSEADPPAIPYFDWRFVESLSRKELLLIVVNWSQGFERSITLLLAVPAHGRKTKNDLLQYQLSCNQILNALTFTLLKTAHSKA